MNEQIVIVTLFACGLTLMFSPWVEKKLDDYVFKRKLKKYDIESTGNRYLDRLLLVLNLDYSDFLTQDDIDFLNAFNSCSSVVFDACKIDYD